MTTAPNSYKHLITQKTTTHSDAPTVHSVLYAGVLLSRAQDRGIREEQEVDLRSPTQDVHARCSRAAAAID